MKTNNTEVDNVAHLQRLVDFSNDPLTYLPDNTQVDIVALLQRLIDFSNDPFAYIENLPDSSIIYLLREFNHIVNQIVELPHMPYFVHEIDIQI